MYTYICTPYHQNGVIFTQIPFMWGYPNKRRLIIYATKLARVNHHVESSFVAQIHGGGWFLSCKHNRPVKCPKNSFSQSKQWI